MSCYHPMIRYEDTTQWKIANDGHRYHPAKIYQANDETEALEFVKSNIKYNAQIIPCGKCIGCRLEYSREWANRGYLESKLWDQNWFLTLTYNEIFKPYKDEITDSNGFTWTDPGDWNGTLEPKDFTKFMHNLRQIMHRDYNENNIRFMGCGEYGSQGERPHYHLILFNLNLPISDLYDPHISNNNVYYKSHIVDRAWGKGIAEISECTWNAIAYTARYITKKINGKLSEEHYASMGQNKEFFRVSRMPGIGQKYFEEHWQEIYKNDEIIIKNTEGTISCRPPKYFDKLLMIKDPKLYDQIRKNRKHRKQDTDKLNDTKTSLTRLEQLTINERSKEEKTQKLVRSFEMQANR